MFCFVGSIHPLRSLAECIREALPAGKALAPARGRGQASCLGPLEHLFQHFWASAASDILATVSAHLLYGLQASLNKEYHQVNPCTESFFSVPASCTNMQDASSSTCSEDCVSMLALDPQRAGLPLCLQTPSFKRLRYFNAL